MSEEKEEHLNTKCITYMNTYIYFESPSVALKICNNQKSYKHCLTQEKHDQLSRTVIDTTHIDELARNPCQILADYDILEVPINRFICKLV